MAELKTKKNDLDPKIFIAQIKDEQKKIDCEELLKIFEDVTGYKSEMWGASMIGYGSYHYKSDRSTQEGDWPLVAFSPRSQNITIYIMSGAGSYPDLLATLGKYKVSGGSCVYVKKLSDIHLPTLKKIIKKSVTDMKKKYK